MGPGLCAGRDGEPRVGVPGGGRRIAMEPSRPGGGAKPSKVEAIKLASEYLKTYVAGEVDNGSSHFSEEAATVLKFHGSYQQDDRDLRSKLKKEGKEKAHQFMVR